MDNTKSGCFRHSVFVLVFKFFLLSFSSLFSNLFSDFCCCFVVVGFLIVCLLHLLHYLTAIHITLGHVCISTFTLFSVGSETGRVINCPCCKQNFKPKNDGMIEIVSVHYSEHQKMKTKTQKRAPLALNEKTRR